MKKRREPELLRNVKTYKKVYQYDSRTSFEEKGTLSLACLRRGAWETLRLTTHEGDAFTSIIIFTKIIIFVPDPKSVGAGVRVLSSINVARIRFQPMWIECVLA